MTLLTFSYEPWNARPCVTPAPKKRRFCSPCRKSTPQKAGGGNGWLVAHFVSKTHTLFRVPHRCFPNQTNQKRGLWDVVFFSETPAQSGFDGVCVVQDAGFWFKERDFPERPSAVPHDTEPGHPKRYNTPNHVCIQKHHSTGWCSGNDPVWTTIPFLGKD
mmetsp:Transcript_26268/g.30231  ORF Transcript_26268/g.30231 Transcript_26268/m.30231 type:complete len:160 (+) Transcript_26268:172-651(+)